MKEKSAVEQPIALWNITNRCNLDCKYCYQNAGTFREELSLERSLDLVDEFKEIGVWAISFGGGEPLLRKDNLYHITKKASKKGMLCAIMTNGTLLTKETVEELKQNGISRASISLDSTNRNIHDSYRGRNGYWETTMKGVMNCLEGGLMTKISATIGQRNFSDIEKIIAFGNSLGLGEIEFTTLLPVGRGKDMIKEFLSENQVGEMLKLACQYSGSGAKITMATNPEFTPCLKKYVVRNGSKVPYKLKDDIGCMAGIGWFAIQPEGYVTPCVLIPNLVIGDVRKDSFVNIWKKSSFLQTLRNRDNLNGKCGSCENKYSCGGCRAKVYAKTGDLMAGDSSCSVYQKKK